MIEVLVTGANGFVGSHICEVLLSAGFDVRALVRKTSDLTNLKGSVANLVYGELVDPASLAQAVEGVDYVISNAGLTRALHPDDFQKVNAGGTENILRAVIKANPRVRRFIQISSTAACGPAPTSKPINEDHYPNPITAYGRSKLNAEKAVLSYKDRIPVTILRPSAVYGPRDKDLLTLFKAVRIGIKPAFGYGESFINFTYVKDLAAAVVKAMQSDTASGRVYFVAEKRAYSYSEAGDIISELLGGRALDIHVPAAALIFAGKISEGIARLRKKPSIFSADKAREIAQKYWLMDTTRIEAEMGFTARTDLRSGAKETIEWYRKEKWL